MALPILFWALTILCCTYGAVFGGRDGRMVAAIFITGALLTIPAQILQESWNQVAWPVMIVDFAVLVGLYWVAMRTNRWWPLWVTGFHLIAMTSHLAVLVAPHFAARVYFGLATLWAVPMLLVILIGVARDRRFGITDHD